MIKKILLIVLSLLLMSPAYSKNISGDWHNDLRSLFQKNNAIIYTINIRTFNAKDKNGNELIDEDEESGNFINAIDELDNLVKMGINTIHVLPITPVGKIKAFGTAGSLYAMSSLTSVNPQLVSKSSTSNGLYQAKRFISECHKRNIRVIIDLPSCAAYDFYVEHPEYFVKDENNNPVVPLDWTDIRLFDCGTEKAVNEDLMSLHKKFIDMIMSLGADGLRADVARLKSALFWEELITYAREKDSEFLFLAEASPLWTEPVSKYATNTSNEQLLEVGFDGYLGSFMNFKNMKTSKEFMNVIKYDMKLFKKYDEKKSVIGSFSTHDEVSPVNLHGPNFSKMIIWLNTTLPVNSYFIDGFPTGDTYNYSWANKPAKNSQTDDEYYFTHNGQIDIFNFSRKPGVKINKRILSNFKQAYKFRADNIDLVVNGEFTPLKTDDDSIFAFMISEKCKNPQRIIVLGNLDFKNTKDNIKIKIPKLSKNAYIELVQGDGSMIIHKRKLSTSLTPGEIEVAKIDY